VTLVTGALGCNFRVDALNSSPDFLYWIDRLKVCPLFSEPISFV
jgi:hypothetical protein